MSRKAYNNNHHKAATTTTEPKQTPAPSDGAGDIQPNPGPATTYPCPAYTCNMTRRRVATNATDVLHECKRNVPDS